MRRKNPTTNLYVQKKNKSRGKEKPETIHSFLTSDGARRRKPAPASVLTGIYAPHYCLKTRFVLISRLLCNARLSCKSLKFDLNDNVIATDLKLSPLVKNPLKAKSTVSS
ncbi:hypothetical protein HID58_018038 [Brassica napus]|uniref:Uncharacterized protein n=1 Tax=Brassica napus TaxID=3708 RepID=A0ABQ8D8T4_BRANA|nr:hypothetical protein HID58_018038 [Brassica napus]